MNWTTLHDWVPVAAFVIGALVLCVIGALALHVGGIMAWMKILDAIKAIQNAWRHSRS
jgi:hypothetical protein